LLLILFCFWFHTAYQTDYTRQVLGAREYIVLYRIVSNRWKWGTGRGYSIFSRWWVLVVTRELFPAGPGRASAVNGSGACIDCRLRRLLVRALYRVMYFIIVDTPEIWQ